MDAARVTAVGASAGARNNAGAQRAQTQRETGTCSVRDCSHLKKSRHPFSFGKIIPVIQ